MKLGYVDELQEMMKGNFTTMEPTFSSGGAAHAGGARPEPAAPHAPRQVRRPVAERSRARSAPDSEIAKSFEGLVDPKWKSSGKDARRIPMPIEIDRQRQATSRALIDFVAQKNEYDIDFLWRRARLRGYVVEIRKYPNSDDEFLYFGPSTGESTDPYRLAWGSGLMDLKVTLTTANQVKKVTVHGWDRGSQKPIEESADWSDPKLKQLNPKSAEIVNAATRARSASSTRPVFTRDEAQEARPATSSPATRRNWSRPRARSSACRACAPARGCSSTASAAG